MEKVTKADLKSKQIELLKANAAVATIQNDLKQIQLQLQIQQLEASEEPAQMGPGPQQ